MNSKLFSIFSFFCAFSRTFANSECEGCSTSSTCDVTFVKDNVYGCGGIWDDDASHLCNDGYEICSSSNNATKLGLTYDLCVNSLSLEKNSFYMSLQTIDNNENNIYMGDDLYTEILGCANKNSDSWLFINKNGYNVASQNIFGAQLSIIDSDEAWKFGWYIDEDEIKHTYSDKSINGDIMGGVLCCRSARNEQTSGVSGAENKATTPSPTQGDNNNDNDVQESNDDITTEATTFAPIETTISSPIEATTLSPIKATTSSPIKATTSSPIEATTSTTTPPHSTKGLTSDKCCHAYYTDRYELRCNLLTTKDVCTDSSVARRCYWNNNDCKNDDNSLLADPDTTCQCKGSGDRKQYYCSQISDQSNCMFQNCNWKCN